MARKPSKSNLTSDTISDESELDFNNPNIELEGVASDEEDASIFPEIGDISVALKSGGELYLDDLELGAVPAARKAKERSPVVPPLHYYENMNLFDYLSNCRPPLVKKIIDIACYKTQTLGDLREEASQEISILWANAIPDVNKYKPGEIASYAEYIGRHAALRVRRELGSAVKLPGSAFRKRKDGTSYVTPGILSDAVPWGDIESWTQVDESSDSARAASSLASEAASGMTEVSDSLIISEETTESQLLEARMAILESRRDLMSDRQFLLMKDFIDGLSFDEIMAKYDIKKGILLREISVAGCYLTPDDAEY